MVENMTEYFSLCLRAINTGDDSSLERLIASEKVNLEEVDSDGRTLLMNAIAPEMSSPRMVRILLQNGADLDHQDHQDICALHIAARNDKVEILSLLLNWGANPNILDQYGNNAIALAIFGNRTDFRSVRLLMEKGADPTIKNKHGNSALDTARKMGAVDLLSLLELRKQ
jgi:ankyrin repeat protein